MTCKIVEQHLVMKIEVDVCNEGKMHEALITYVDSDDQSKSKVVRFPDLGEAFEHVFRNLMNVKIQEAMAMQQFGGERVGNA